MGRKKDAGERPDPAPYGEQCKHDPSFRGPIQNRSCTDVLCCALFLVFLAGYMVVGILAWLYGDPRQVIYPRNSTGAYCGIGANRDKPFVLYFDLLQCVTSINILAAAMNGLQCPTTQICVSACPEGFWVLPPTAYLSGVKPAAVFNQTWCVPSLNLSDTILTVSQIQSRELCPWYTIASKPTFNRCLPDFSTTSAEKAMENFTFPGTSSNATKELILSGATQIVKSLNAKDIGTKIFEDFASSWYWILIGLLIAMLLSLLFLLLLRLLAGVLVWVLILGVLAIGAYGIYHCWNEYSTLRAAGATIQDVGFTTNLSVYSNVQETWLAALIILAVVEGVLLLLLIFLRKRILIAIALIKEASRAIGYMMSTLFYPLVTFLLLIICVAYWAMTALYLATSGTPLYRVTSTNSSLSGCSAISGNESCNPMTFNASQYEPCRAVGCTFYAYNSEGLFQRNLFNLQLYNVLGLLWVANFALALGQCVLAGAFAAFYWAREKPRDVPACALAGSFMRALRYHTGSLAFGALILTIVQLIRIILEYLDHKLKDVQNPFTRCLLCCLKCCFWCLEKFIKFLNRNAYIMIAIYGKNFCTSAKNAFKLLMRNIVRVVVLDKVTDLLLLFGKLLVVGGVGVLGFFFFSGRIPITDPRFRSPTLNYYWLPILTVVVGAYLIAQGFFSVYSMCVDTLFLCFLEDLERNDGSAEKPYYMPTSLMRLLNKKNKGEKKK
ncbi:choline transporter-like protein 4 [Emydura macquarii macquarii]|uniref:choline transporter-like protein 4 n=1 Tax=Emydura macquarii macquarii TaxID=1129001 RepID=UPI003529ECF9